MTDNKPETIPIFGLISQAIKKIITEKRALMSAKGKRAVNKLVGKGPRKGANRKKVSSELGLSGVVVKERGFQVPERSLNPK